MTRTQTPSGLVSASKMLFDSFRVSDNEMYALISTNVGTKITWPHMVLFYFFPCSTLSFIVVLVWSMNNGNRTLLLFLVMFTQNKQQQNICRSSYTSDSCAMLLVAAFMHDASILYNIYYYVSCIGQKMLL